MRAVPPIWSLALLFAPLTGCEESSCGQTGCLGTVELVLSEPLGVPGAYVVDVQMGAKDAARCTVSLPAGRSECDQRWAEALVHPDSGLEGLVVYRTDVDAVSVSVARDGRVIGGGTYRPSYERWFPNGPTCDAQPCRHAVVEVGVVTGAGASADPKPQ